MGISNTGGSWLRLGLEEVMGGGGKMTPPGTEEMKRSYKVDFGGSVNTPAPACGICCVSSTPAGEWDVPASLTPFHGCSSGLYDYERARFVTPSSGLSPIAMCGGVDLIIPEGVEVRQAGFELCGTYNDNRSPSAKAVKAGGDQKTPRIVIQDIALCGRVIVYEPGQQVGGGCCCCAGCSDCCCC